MFARIPRLKPFPSIYDPLGAANALFVTEAELDELYRVASTEYVPMDGFEAIQQVLGIEVIPPRTMIVVVDFVHKRFPGVCIPGDNNVH